MGLIDNWRRENLAVSQQAEVHIANELLPMSNWAEIKNTVPCRKLMTAFPLKCALILKSNPTKAEIPSTFIQNIVGLHFHKGSFSITLNKFLYKRRCSTIILNSPPKDCPSCHYFILGRQQSRRHIGVG